MGDIRRFTVQTSQNVALGQGGTSFVKSGGTAITAQNIVAITIIEDATFSTLTSASTFAGVDSAGVEGSAIDNTLTFPAGVTIYGGWTDVTVSGGSVICYHG